MTTSPRCGTLLCALVLQASLLLLSCGGGGGGNTQGGLTTPPPGGGGAPPLPPVPAGPTLFSTFADIFGEAAPGEASFHATSLTHTGQPATPSYYNTRTSRVNGSLTAISLTSSELSAWPTWLPRQEVLSIGANGIRTFTTGEQTQTFGPPGLDLLRLRLPVVAGDRYTTYRTAQMMVADFDGDGAPDRRTTTIEVLVRPPEALDTPAGSFSEAVPVDTIVTMLDQGTRSSVFTWTSTRTEWLVRGLGIVRMRLDHRDRVLTEEPIGFSLPTVRAGAIGPHALTRAYTGQVDSGIFDALGPLTLRATSDGRFVMLTRVIDRTGGPGQELNGARAVVMGAAAAVEREFDLFAPRPFVFGLMGFGFNGRTLLAAAQLSRGYITGFASDLSGTSHTPIGIPLTITDVMVPTDMPQAITTDGDDFVLQWSRGGSAKFPGRYLRRLSGDGTPSGPEWLLPLADTSGPTALAAVNGLHFISLAGRTSPQICDDDLFGMRIDAQGNALDPSPVRLVDLEKQQRYPLLSSSEAGSFIVWSDLRRTTQPWTCPFDNEDWDVYVARLRVDATAPATLTNDRLLGTAWGSSRPSLGAGGDRVVVGWSDIGQPGVGERGVHIRVLDASQPDLPVVESRLFAGTNNVDTFMWPASVTVAVAGNAYAVAWRNVDVVRGVVVYPRLTR